MKTKLFILFIAVSGLIYSCNSGVEVSQDNNDETTVLEEGVHKVVVEEVIQANAYTYLRVKENDAEMWLAVGKREVNQGGTYYFEGELEMKDFESKELGRVFESIYFVDEIRDNAVKKITPVNGETSNGAAVTEKTEVNVEKAEGGITIEELFANKASFSGQKVKIQGKIVKINFAIMGKNWVHIQDGTSHGESYDLTITTAEEFEKDEVVTFEGTVTLEKDFGAGYFYDVIVEDATAVK